MKKKAIAKTSRISNYFCFTQLFLGYNNITDLYYYSGNLLKESDGMIKFDHLPESAQLAILTRFADLKELDFKNWRTGKRNQYYAQNTFFDAEYPWETKMVQVCEVDFNTLAPSPEYLDMYLQEGILRDDILMMANRSICVYMHQYLRKNDTSKKKR